MKGGGGISFISESYKCQYEPPNLSEPPMETDAVPRDPSLSKFRCSFVGRGLLKCLG